MSTSRRRSSTQKLISSARGLTRAPFPTASISMTRSAPRSFGSTSRSLTGSMRAKSDFDARAPIANAMTFDEIRLNVAALESDIADGPIVPAVAPEEIRAHLASRYDFKQPADLDDVVADVEQMLRTWQVQVTHPRYFGLFNPSVTLASIVADTLVAMYNPQLASWRTSPAANEIERHTLSWLGAKFGLPADSAASFTSGGAEANLSAVVVALKRGFPAY